MLPLQGAEVASLVRGLKYHMPHGVARITVKYKRGLQLEFWGPDPICMGRERG